MTRYPYAIDNFNLDYNIMIHPIDMDRDDVLAYSVDGEIDQQAMEKTINEIKPKLQGNSSVSIYLEVVDLNGIKPEAFKSRINFAFSHFKTILKQVDKVALVTDLEWLRNLASGVYHLSPAIEQKSFVFKDADVARDWILKKKST